MKVNANKTLARLSVFTLVFLALACGGKETDGGTAAAASNGSEVGSTSPIPTSFSATAVQNALNNCGGPSTPPGRTPPTTIKEFREQLTGAWWLCGAQNFGSDVNPLPNAGPIVITEDGRWITLVSDGNGGLVVGTAATDNYTYSIQTVFEGHTIVDVPPGQLLGVKTTVVLTSADGTKVEFGNPFFPGEQQGTLDLVDDFDGGDIGWSFTSLAP